MNLKEIADRLFKERKLTPVDGLSDIAQAEIYLQQAYEGRYFFELIQNVRDANKEKNDQDGDVIIKLKENILSISNSGAEFSEAGIKGITRIGRSTKRGQDYIGFKGIGFKSVQEISEAPRIITRYGSIYFDRNLTLEKYKDDDLKAEEIPLFYFPHYHTRKLTAHEIAKGIVTKIELPVKENITETQIADAFSEIQAKQLVLLGNIKWLSFESENNVTNFAINKNSQKRFIEVKEKGKPGIKFRYFTPTNRVAIPEEIIQSLEGKEKDIFSGTSHVDINIVLELSENGQVQPVEDAKLYLFYPLQISSGFRFIIHSYFIVNPERKALRDSALNDFLLAAIGKFIGTEMLKQLREKKTNTNKILPFRRNNDAGIDILYDSLVAELKEEQFIFDTKTQKYFPASEVMVADGESRGLFPDGKLGDKHLIYTDDEDFIDWLQDEFEVLRLGHQDIADQIERECTKQAKNKNVRFFQNLYNYVSQHQQLSLMGKKVLLTDDWKLVSSEEDVFYGGGKRNPINLAASIKKQIHFIQKGIKIADFREGRSRTGITEFNTYELVRRLLKLFNLGTVPNADLLNALYNLQPLDVKSHLEIREKILLPVKGSGKWLSPVITPIYFETDHLKELYPNGNFVNDNVLKWEGQEASPITIKEFLLKFGVWEIPAVYLNETATRVYVKENRDKLLGSVSGLTSRPYYILHDRVLDKPTKYTHWFTNAIIDHWSTYQGFILSDLLPGLEYSSHHSYYRNANDYMTVKLSDFIETLSTQKWIVFNGETEGYSAGEVVGIKFLDFSQPHNKVIERYLKLLPVNYDQKRDLIEAVGLTHLDGNALDHFVKLLALIHKKYAAKTPAGRDFIDFYNRILSKIVDFYFNNDQKVNIDRLADEYFLSVNDVSNATVWAKARQVFYIDDKPNYDLLPGSIKEKVQPHFTNRDKNTFGRIAAKIGKKFSNSIQRALIETDAVRTSTLLSHSPFLPEAIAILESTIDSTVMNDDLEKVRSIRVFEKENLEVKISVGDSGAMIIPISHYVDTDADLDIHLSRANVFSTNKQISEAISELFINLLGRDLRKFHLNLLLYLNTKDKKEFLINYDILDERVNEIRDKLNTFHLTNNQKFWEAILRAKEISSRENIFTGEGVDSTSLARLLRVSEEVIEKVQSEFNFNHTSISSNIEVLIELLNALSLTLELLNQNIFPKIDFRDDYGKRLASLRNRFEGSFNAMLHGYLASQSGDEQANYQDELDRYKRYLQFSVPVDVLDLDVEQFFLDSINAAFKFLHLSRADLHRDHGAFDPVAVYTTNFNLLKAKLGQEEFAAELLDTFLADNKKRSLLYFDEVDTLADSFRKWMSELKKRAKTTDKEEDQEAYLSQFSNPVGAAVETVATREAEGSESNGYPAGSQGGGGGGWRYDGGGNDEHKRMNGLIAEKVVYEMLSNMYEKVTWVSKYASKIYKTHPGYNPEGQDGLGYDIEYFDDEGNQYFVEVKSRVDNEDAFDIYQNEIDKARKEQEFYKIYFVTNTLDNSNRRIRDLGNLFMLEDGQDFFANRRFKAVYKNFEIRFVEE